MLAPGCHVFTLVQLEQLCVSPFSGNAHTRRERLFLLLEELVQRLLVAKIPCSLYIDGSFLTVKPEPNDVDVIARIELGVYEALTDYQKQVFESINLEPIDGLDSHAVSSYPRDHPHFGTLIDVGNPGEAYGLEHSQRWLKGYAKVTLGETDVGNRICR
jgi:hypothetical protein